MKTIIRLLVILPLLSLGGCYTQLALRDHDRRSQQNEEKDEYAYEDVQADSTDSTNYYNDNVYYDEYGANNFLYRRYFGFYYPSLAFSMGWAYGFDLMNRDHFFYGLFGRDYYSWNPFWGYGGYGGYGYYGHGYYYNPFYNTYYNNYPYWYNDYSSAGYKYRTYSAYRTRGDDGERGSGNRNRNFSGDRSRPSGSYSGTGSDRGSDVDLRRARVSRGTNSTGGSETRVSKDIPRKTDNTVRDGNARTRSRDGSRATDNSSSRSGTRDRSERSSGSSGRERQAPSYTPRSGTSSSPSYNPPSSSSGSGRGGSSGGSDRGSGSSGSNRGSSSGGSDRGSGSSGGSDRIR